MTETTAVNFEQVSSAIMDMLTHGVKPTVAE